MSFSLTRPTKLREDLNTALKHQHWSQAETLLRQGATVNPDEWAQESLWLAANKAQTGCAAKDRWVGWDWLIRQGARFTPRVGEKLLIESMTTGALGRLDWLLDHGVALPKAGSDSAFHLAQSALKRLSVKGVEWLETHGVAVDPVRPTPARSALYEVVNAHLFKPVALDYVKLLGQCGANTRPSGHDQLTPLQKVTDIFFKLCQRERQASFPTAIDSLWEQKLVPLVHELERLGDDRHAPRVNHGPTAWTQLETAAAFPHIGPVPTRVVGILQAEVRKEQANGHGPPRARAQRRRS